MNIKLITKSNDDNHLGLLPEKHQSPALIQIGAFAPFKKLWLCDAPSKRIKIMRKAYEALAIKSSQPKIKQLLISMSSKQLSLADIDTAVDDNPENTALKSLQEKWKKIATNEAKRFENTLKAAATHSKYGFVAAYKNRDSNLAAIINIFSKLYQGKEHNPLFDNAEIIKKLSSDQIQVKSNAVKETMKLIGDAIVNLMKLGKSELDMAFADDDSKYPAIISQLKLHYNHLAIKCDYEMRFSNKEKEQKSKEYQKH